MALEAAASGAEQGEVQEAGGVLGVLPESPVESSRLRSCPVVQAQGCLSVRHERSSGVVGGSRGSVQQRDLNGFPEKLLVLEM